MQDFEIVRYIIEKSNWAKPKLHIGCHRIVEGEKRFSEFSSEQMIQRGKVQVKDTGNNTPTDRALSQADEVRLDIVKEIYDSTLEKVEFIKDRVRIGQDTEKFELLGNQISEKRVGEIREEILKEFQDFYNGHKDEYPNLKKLSLSERTIFRDNVIDLVMYTEVPMTDAFNHALNG